MNIVYSCNDPKFSALNPGDAFYYNDELYMKIADYNDCKYNCVALKDGDLYNYDDNVIVEYAPVTIVGR